jgi:metallo-beta-lactamase family protein
MKISFLGAAQTVTGSRFLVETPGKKLLVDCGLFQGPRVWKERNWAEFAINPAEVDLILLTHAHIDHAGFLPRFAKLGFRGNVICTPATAELLKLLLPDSARLQEEDAAFANKKRYTTHDPALPLYTEEDALQLLQQIQPVDFYQQTQLSPEFSFTFMRAGHILGSAMIEMRIEGMKVVFTGDLGRPSQFIIKSPDTVQSADYLILESTYGNRLHQRIDVKEKLTEIIVRTASNGGTILVPAFAIGRTQELLFLLRGLEEQKRIPHIPIYIDSPMAIEAISIYDRHFTDASKELEVLRQRDSTPFLFPEVHPLRSVSESMTLNSITSPCIIVSASGMATGGRILHHLKRRISDHRNTILFIGFQAEGTKGRLLVDGIREIKIHGKQYPVAAKIEYMDALSCHADYDEILGWLHNFQAPPRKVFLVHGEVEASRSMAQRIGESYGWNVHPAEYLETVELSGASVPPSS